jgi:hypothetical protein
MRTKQVREYYRKYYMEHHETMRARAREWQKNNPEKYKASQLAYRARQQELKKKS